MALREIWSIAGVTPDQVDLVGLSGREYRAETPVNNDHSLENGEQVFSLKVAEVLGEIPVLSSIMQQPLALRGYGMIDSLIKPGALNPLKEELAAVGVHAPIMRFDHHDCHLASAYYTSGWDDCLILSNDGFGDGICAKVAIAKNGVFETVSENSFYNSIGLYYNHVTHFCGFPKNYHAGKVTGLAAHGDPSKTIQYFRDSIPWVESEGRYINRGPVFRKGLERLHAVFKGVEPKHVAAGIQRHLEEVLVSQAKHYMNKYGQRKLVLVGGIHANVRANQAIAEIPGVEGVFVFPNMGDGGLGLGAAFLALAKGTGAKLKPQRLETIYMGPDYSEAAVKKALDDEKLEYTRPADVAKTIAEFLKAGKIVACCHGPMEFGPRALGNRSILYPAIDPTVNTWLNTQLDRTEFMPFAPIMRAEDAPAMLKNYDERTAHTAEFMTITYTVTERCKKESPAIVHLDDTARPQVLHKGVNDLVYNILTEYKKLTGLSVLVNTSFNMHNEPIVCSPEDGVRSFLQGNLDVLMIGPFVVENKRKTH
jgi:carbamoyltransferase